MNKLLKSRFICFGDHLPGYTESIRSIPSCFDKLSILDLKGRELYVPSLAALTASLVLHQSALSKTSSLFTFVVKFPEFPHFDPDTLSQAIIAALYDVECEIIQIKGFKLDDREVPIPRNVISALEDWTGQCFAALHDTDAFLSGIIEFDDLVRLFRALLFLHSGNKGEPVPDMVKLIETVAVYCVHRWCRLVLEPVTERIGGELGKPRSHLKQLVSLMLQIIKRWNTMVSPDFVHSLMVSDIKLY